MKIVISIPLINCDFAGGEHYRDTCYFYSINKSKWRQDSTMYNHYEKGKAPDLESVLVDFMTYQASSKGDCYSMQQQGTQFEKDYSFEDYQWES